MLAGQPLRLGRAAGWRCGRQAPSAQRITGASSCGGVPQARSVHTAAAASSSELAPGWNDIVEYTLLKPVGAATLGIGRVEEVGPDAVTIAPLEEEDDVWVEGHDGQLVQVPPSAVLRIIDFDLSQRQDRESNPHGEHAHDVYRLLQPPSGATYRGPRSLPVVVRDAAAS